MLDLGLNQWSAALEVSTQRNTSPMRVLAEVMFEDIKVVIRRRKSTNRQHNGQTKKNKQTNNTRQILHRKLKIIIILSYARPDLGLKQWSTTLEARTQRNTSPMRVLAEDKFEDIKVVIRRRWTENTKRIKKQTIVVKILQRKLRLPYTNPAPRRGWTR